MLVNYKCPHSRSFGPNNLSLIVWLFHSTRRMWRMWTGDTRAWMSGRASAHRLNFSFNLSLTWAKLQHASIFFSFYPSVISEQALNPPCCSGDTPSQKRSLFLPSLLRFERKGAQMDAPQPTGWHTSDFSFSCHISCLFTQSSMLVSDTSITSCWWTFLLSSSFL